MSTFQLQSPLRNTTQIIANVPTGGVNAGEFITLNNVNGFALTTVDPYAVSDLSIESARNYTLITEAEMVLAEKSAGVINAGQNVFYNTSTAKVSTSSTGNTFVGYALESVGSSATQVRIKFVGQDRT